MNLSFREFNKIVRKYTLKGKVLVVPLYDEIVADTETPVSVFLKIAWKEKYAYLLESAETNLQWGRYSFISVDPYVLFLTKKDKVNIYYNGVLKSYKGSHFVILKKLIKNFILPADNGYFSDLPRFFGGFVGYVGYENVHLIEPKVPKPKIDSYKDISDIYLMFNRTVFIFDHYLNKLKIIRLVFVEDKNEVKKLYFDAVEELERIKQIIKTTIALPQEINIDLNTKVNVDVYNSNMTKEKFINVVKRAKEYIYRGDVIQVVLSRQLWKHTTAEPFNIYRTLKMINPSPYMFYLKFDNLFLIGSSPEILVRKEGNVVETRPIAGTRPRGDTEERDNFYEQQLLSSEKENAEHIMLVDLARNDIGRITQFGTISLPQFKIVEKYSHVMHIVSSVKGVLKNGKDCIDVLLSCFPAGTVSGAPKVRAMQIISELEQQTRGPYAGSVGYFGLNDNMDMAITIRTIMFKDSCVYIQTGAGIVADSEPEKEYEETVNKAKALMLAVKIAEGIK